jgi:hypothetical protein
MESAVFVSKMSSGHTERLALNVMLQRVVRKKTKSRRAQHEMRVVRLSYDREIRETMDWRERVISTHPLRLACR